MPLLLLLALVLMLSGCARNSIKPVPVQSKQQGLQLYVQWEDNPTEGWLQRGGYGAVDGYALWGNRWCVIYASKPRSLYDAKRFEVLGHELLHCTDGHYH